MRKGLCVLIGLILQPCAGGCLAESGFVPVASKPGLGSPIEGVEFFPAEVTLGEQIVGETGVVHHVLVRNRSRRPARLVDWSVIGDLEVTSYCAAELSAGSQCELHLRFQPKRAGAHLASLIVFEVSRGELLSLRAVGRGLPRPSPRLAADRLVLPTLATAPRSRSSEGRIGRRARRHRFRGAAALP